MSTTHKGGCFCGQIRYETSGPPFQETSCHCAICRGTHRRRLGGMVQPRTLSVSLHSRRADPLQVDAQRDPRILRPVRHPTHLRD